MSLTRLRHVPPPGPQPTLAELVRRCGHLGRELTQYHRLHWKPMLQGLVDHQWAPSDVRVPLDRGRHGVRSLDWRSLAVEDMRITSQSGLIDVIGVTGTHMREHTGHVHTESAFVFITFCSLMILCIIVHKSSFTTFSGDILLQFKNIHVFSNFSRSE